MIIKKLVPFIGIEFSSFVNNWHSEHWKEMVQLSVCVSNWFFRFKNWKWHIISKHSPVWTILFYNFRKWTVYFLPHFCFHSLLTLLFVEVCKQETFEENKKRKKRKKITKSVLMYFQTLKTFIARFVLNVDR